MTDQELAQFVKTNSPQTFRALVDRHGKAVYAQCVRQLHDAHLAEDVTQTVFMVLARKAKSLPSDVILPAWLFNVTRYACANARRSEMRRKRYEQEAAMTRQIHDSSSIATASSDLDPVLDEALSRLGKTDRQALLLRFYSGMNSAEVGENLGLSADTTKRRISRAIEKLRDILHRQGINIVPAAILTRLESFVSTSVPHDLANKIVIHALNPAAASPWCATMAKGVIQMMRFAQIKIGVLTALLFIAVSGGGIALSVAVAQFAQNSASAPQPMDPGQRSIDQALIRASIERFTKAIRSNDRASLDQCLNVATDDDGALVKAMLLENMGYRHLQTAWEAKFKSPIKFRNIGFVWLPQLDGGAESLLELALANVQDSEIQISGIKARMPMKFGEHNKELSDFAGFWLALVNDGVAWKIDMTRTLRITVNMQFQSGKEPISSDEEIRIAINQKLGLAKILDEAATSIEKGDFKTPADASEKIELWVGQSFRSFGLNGISYGFAPAQPRSTMGQ